MRHGHHANGKPTPTYVTWQHMKARCDSVTHHARAYYGGRGITYQASWQSFEQFLADMGTRPPGTSLDRKDNTLGYTKENCRWATAGEQANNRRPARPPKLSHADRESIRSELAKGVSGVKLARVYGVTPARISQVKLAR